MNRNFNEIYQQICQNGINELVDLKKNRDMYLALVWGINIIAVVMLNRLYMNQLFYLIWIILIIVIGVCYIKTTSKYKKRYKHAVIKELVKLYNQNLSFYEDRGIGITDYALSGFNNSVTNCYFSDLIEGEILENSYLKMSEVKVLTDDSEGVNIAFEGLFGFVNLPVRNINTIEIVPNKDFHKYHNKRIEMDSSEFEKRYDILARNKLQATQIFTSNLLDKFNEFNEYTEYLMEIKIRGNKAFFRIKCKEAFEAPKIKEALDYGMLYKYFRMIDLPINIMQELIKNVEQLEQ